MTDDEPGQGVQTPEGFDVTPTFNPDDELEVAVTYVTEANVRETALLSTEEARRLASALGVAANNPDGRRSDR